MFHGIFKVLDVSFLTYFYKLSIKDMRAKWDSKREKLEIKFNLEV